MSPAIPIQTFLSLCFDIFHNHLCDHGLKLFMVGTSMGMQLKALTAQPQNPSGVTTSVGIGPKSLPQTMNDS